jgi:CheY-like chemotaxis protein
MPDMNGLELYNSLKAINRNVRIIFVTALDIAQELVSILPGLKEKDVIRKPISRSELLKLSKNPQLNLSNSICIKASIVVLTSVIILVFDGDGLQQYMKLLQ